MRAVPGGGALDVHTTPRLGTDAEGVQARIAGVLDQKLYDHSMEREREWRGEKGEKRPSTREGKVES